MIGSFRSPLQGTAFSSLAWACPVEVHWDRPAEASFGRELRTAPYLEFEPGSSPWEAHSY